MGMKRKIQKNYERDPYLKWLRENEKSTENMDEILIKKGLKVPKNGQKEPKKDIKVFKKVEKTP